jgi:hypothetical protein
LSIVFYVTGTVEILAWWLKQKDPPSVDRMAEVIDSLIVGPSMAGSGNRDERKFVNGDQFDINRPRVPHLTFGHGIHVCLGNAKPAPQKAAQSAIPGAETWKIILNTAMDPQEFNAHIVRNGETFSGHIDSPMGSEPITNGVASGDTLEWTMAVKKPMPIKVVFDVEVKGDIMTGKAKLGVFGTSSLTGERVR